MGDHADDALNESLDDYWPDDEDRNAEEWPSLDNEAEAPIVYDEEEQ